MSDYVGEEGATVVLCCLVLCVFCFCFLAFLAVIAFFLMKMSKIKKKKEGNKRLFANETLRKFEGWKYLPNSSATSWVEYVNWNVENVTTMQQMRLKPFNHSGLTDSLGTNLVHANTTIASSVYLTGLLTTS